MSDALKQLVRLGNIMIPMIGSDTGGYGGGPGKRTISVVPGYGVFGVLYSTSFWNGFQMVS